MGDRYNLTVQLGIKNNGSAAVDYNLFLVLVYDSVLTIERGGYAHLAQDVLTKVEILDAPIAQSYSYQESRLAWGGSFWTGLKKIGQQVLEVADKAAPYVRLASAVAPYMLAAGEGGAMSGGKYKGGIEVGGAYQGGRVMPPKQIKRKLTARKRF